MATELKPDIRTAAISNRGCRLFFLWLLLLIPGVAIAQDCAEGEVLWTDVIGDRNNIVKGPYTIRYLEREFLREDPDSGKLQPFGASNAQWERVLAKILPGDRVYLIQRVNIPADPGYHVLVQDNCVIDTVYPENN